MFCRRDKEYCHECRYCCTLSVCTNKDGSTFVQSENDLKETKKKGFQHGAPSASFGFLRDMRMYMSYDFRCLKPKPKVKMDKWPHYEMQAFRRAKTEKELGKPSK